MASLDDVLAQSEVSWVVIHGAIYDVEDLIPRHPGGVDGIADFLGKDASKVFPRAPPVTLPQKCLDAEKVEAYNLNVEGPENDFTNPTCSELSELDVLLGITCHTFAAGSDGIAKFMGDFEIGTVSHTKSSLSDAGIQWILIHDRVYDVTAYVRRIKANNGEPLVDGADPSTQHIPAA